MKKEDFFKAVTAYLSNTATSWQKFIVEDYYDSFELEINVLDLLKEEEIFEVGQRVYTGTMIKIEGINEDNVN